LNTANDDHLFILGEAMARSEWKIEKQGMSAELLLNQISAQGADIKN
jgi:hypothetical protein